MKVWITSALDTEAQSATIALRLIGDGFLEPWGRVFAGTYRGEIRVRWRLLHGFWGLTSYTARAKADRCSTRTTWHDDARHRGRAYEPSLPVSVEFAIAAIRMPLAAAYGSGKWIRWRCAAFADANGRCGLTKVVQQLLERKKPQTSGLGLRRLRGRPRPIVKTRHTLLSTA